MTAAAEIAADTAAAPTAAAKVTAETAGAISDQGDGADSQPTVADDEDADKDKEVKKKKGRKGAKRKNDMNGRRERTYSRKGSG